MGASTSTALPLGFGTGNLRSFQGGVSAGAARKLLAAAYDLGIDLIDTAPSYGQGEAEGAIGGLPDVIRSRVQVCSKVGIAYGRGKGGLLSLVKPVLQPAMRAFPPLRRLAGASRDRMRETGSMTVHITPQAIRDSLEGSLRRLRREHLDILLLHDPSEAALGDENVAAFEALRAAGKIRAWGVSTRIPDVARMAVRIGPLDWIQMPADPPWLAEAGEVFPAAAAAGKRIIGNRVLSPLRAEPGPDSRPGPRPDVAECFRNTLRLPGIARVLVGTTSHKHLAQNVATMRRVLGEPRGTP